MSARVKKVIPRDNDATITKFRTANLYPGLLHLTSHLYNDYLEVSYSIIPCGASRFNG